MTLEEAKTFLYYELNFKRNSQSVYFPEERMRPQDVWNVLDNHFLKYDEKVFLKLIEFVKEHKEELLNLN